MGSEGVDCIGLTQDWVQLQAFVEMVNESLGSVKARNFDQLSNYHLFKEDCTVEWLIKYLVGMQKLRGNTEYQYSLYLCLSFHQVLRYLLTFPMWSWLCRMLETFDTLISDSFSLSLHVSCEYSSLMVVSTWAIFSSFLPVVSCLFLSSFLQDVLLLLNFKILQKTAACDVAMFCKACLISLRNLLLFLLFWCLTKAWHKSALSEAPWCSVRYSTTWQVWACTVCYL